MDLLIVFLGEDECQQFVKKPPSAATGQSKGFHAKVLTGKALRILLLAGYFHRAALVNLEALITFAS